jgi:hypothetical protein
LLGSVATLPFCTYRNERRQRGKRLTKGIRKVKIVPHRIEEQINRVDRTRSRAIGIACGISALWCVYRLIWLVYSAATLSSFGWSPVSLVFPLLLWGVIGVVAAIAAIGFLTQYAKPVTPSNPESKQGQP